MGRWRRSRRRGHVILLPIYGEVAARPPEGPCNSPPHSRGGHASLLPIHGEAMQVSSPFMGRWRRSRRRGHVILLPIHGEVAAKPPEGPCNSPPHSRGGGGEAAGGAW